MSGTKKTRNAVAQARSSNRRGPPPAAGSVPSHYDFQAGE